ncbi:MAG: ATP synthase subunit I [Panacagrimonas sp.]
MERVQLRGVRLALALICCQAAITVLATLIAWIVAHSTAGLAALYGGMVAIVPTAYFAFRVYLRRNSDAPRDVVGSFYRGEIGKFALTALLFALGVQWFAEQFLALICAYMACLAAYPAVAAFFSVE